jgi:two-component system cell cycle response regulator
MHPLRYLIRMHDHATLTFLLASPEPALLAAIEPVLLRTGAHVEIALSAQTALQHLTAAVPPALALVDANLPGMAIEDLLARAQPENSALRFPITLITDAVTQQWIDRLAEGMIDDLILRSAEDAYWQLRVDLVLRTFSLAQESEALREAAAADRKIDRLTGVYNRSALLAMLFRETDRVQRMNGQMCLVLFDIDDFGFWNSTLGAEACDDLLCQVAARTTRLLRSYDLLGRPGMDEFLIALPGCGVANALMLAERVRAEVFNVPFHAAGEAVRLAACFGIALSQGRSPVVVLREAEESLLCAKAAGPESIEIFGDAMLPAHKPVGLLLASADDAGKAG